MTVAKAVDEGAGESSDPAPPSPDCSSGFTYVARRNDARARKNRKGRTNAGGVGGQALDAEALLQKRKDIVLARKRELENDHGLQKLLDDVFPLMRSAEAPASNVCSALALGVGSVKDARPAQIQLAFLLLMCERLDIADVHFYDPICNDGDYAILRALSITPLSENLRGKHIVQRNTLVYMPHCTRTLYENMLRVNWSSKGLSHLLLCCNTLDRYVGGGSTTSRATGVAAPCLQRAVDEGLLHVHPIETTSAQTALNDLAIQAFVPASHFTKPLSAANLGKLGDMDSDFWKLPDEVISVPDIELV